MVVHSFDPQCNMNMRAWMTRKSFAISKILRICIKMCRNVGIQCTLHDESKDLHETYEKHICYADSTYPSVDQAIA